MNPFRSTKSHKFQVSLRLKFLHLTCELPPNIAIAVSWARGTRLAESGFLYQDQPDDPDTDSSQYSWQPHAKPLSLIATMQISLKDGVWKEKMSHVALKFQESGKKARELSHRGAKTWITTPLDLAQFASLDGPVCHPCPAQIYPPHMHSTCNYSLSVWSLVT